MSHIPTMGISLLSWNESCTNLVGAEWCGFRRRSSTLKTPQSLIGTVWSSSSKEACTCCREFESSTAFPFFVFRQRVKGETLLLYGSCCFSSLGVIIEIWWWGSSIIMNLNTSSLLSLVIISFTFLSGKEALDLFEIESFKPDLFLSSWARVVVVVSVFLVWIFVGFVNFGGGISNDEVTTVLPLLQEVDRN